ncbi:aspartate aminotransferase family protein [Streptomyces beigongshangae]|uniref:aminotransferase family protein n=1 Tax=Streptomyces beigongshangae TaxID=2841597 RepID=UPI001C84D998|nr:aspartate aminotransferase family protein [Streptomyces sp. REN17]
MPTAYDSQALVSADREHLVHPFLPASQQGRIVMVEGRGCRLRDAEGREYLDATAGMWLCQVGHGRSDIADVAADQMRRLEYSTAFWDFTHDRAITLAQRLVRLSHPDTARVYFTSGGSEGTEAALRMARHYHHRRKEPGRTWILTRTGAYHGAGYASGEVSDFPLYATGFGPQPGHVHRVTAPYPYAMGLADAPEKVTDVLLDELESAIAEIGAHRIAALIGEPVLALGGMIAPPPDYWPRVAELLRHHGILLVMDEVVTAFGRLGHWFAAERMGVRPDLTILSKGLTSGYFPLGAVLLTARLADVLSADAGFPVGHTYSGHPTGCAVALANLDIIERENLLDAADRTGAHLAAGLRSLHDLPLVGETRQYGLMAAVELVTDRTTRTPLPEGTYAIADLVRDRTGVLVRGGPRALTLAPPLVMTENETDEVVAALADVLASIPARGAAASAPRSASPAPSP